MSRVKAVKRARRHNGFHSIPGQAAQRPPVQQQIDMIARGLDRLTYHLSELELMIHFTMRQFARKSVIPGSIITSLDGKPQYESISLFQLFEQQRETFAQQLMEERRAFARAHAAANATDGQLSTGDPDPHEGADRPTGPALVPGGEPQGS